jgi:hypothetical protein
MEIITKFHFDSYCAVLRLRETTGRKYKDGAGGRVSL